MLQSTSTATSQIPSRVKMPGLHHFSIELLLDPKRKHMDFSEPLNKLFIEMNTWVTVKFHLSNLGSSENVFLRALPVYVEGTDYKLPVLR